ncbi:CsgG/HfaB family protein [Kordia sp.]|uniref:CsgG/HfaB family protein n=1 Tax=Kordia sp. TaxID=1965332 RepID=UPI003D6B480F
MNGCLKQLIGLLGLIILIILIANRCQYQYSYDNISNEVAKKMVNELEVNHLNDVSIALFTPLGESQPKIGTYLSNSFRSKVLNLKKSLSLLERTQLNELIKEYRLITSGYVDRTKAIKIGKLIGVKAIIIGEYQVADYWFSQDRITVFIKAVNLQTGELIVSEEVEANYTDQMKSFDD